MNILALDMGGKTGWRLYNQGLRSDLWRYSGVQEFTLKRGESPGMRWLRFRAWLEQTNHHSCRIAGRIDLVVYEMPHHRGGASTAAGLGYKTEVEAFAAGIGAETMPVHSATLKKWATGSGRAGKPDMIRAAHALGYTPADDNEADAILLLEYALEELTITKERDQDELQSNRTKG